MATSCRGGGAAIPRHLRKAWSFDLEVAYVRDVTNRVAAAAGLFHAWLFDACARRLGAEAAWQERLLPQQPQHADGNPASTFPVDDSVFSATDGLWGLAERRSRGVCINVSHILGHGKCRSLAA